MDKLNITSERSRSRAWELCQEMRWEVYRQHIQDLENQRNTEELLLNDGYILSEFTCEICHKLCPTGIKLLNCHHSICPSDFGSIIQQCAIDVKTPLCPICNANIDLWQVEKHAETHVYNQLTDALSRKEIESWEEAKTCLDPTCKQLHVLSDQNQTFFTCERCNKSNCLTCQALHEVSADCKYYQFNQNNPFRNKWTGQHRSDNCNLSNYVVLQPVEQASEEWKAVVETMKYNNINKIERVEHPYLWRKYAEYCLSLGQQLNEVRVHHGTRANKPELIYSSGFDLSKAKIGNCLWFAVDSNYSRGGYQYALGNGQLQIFVSLVATGNVNDVKFIRNNAILNVYKNEATYPGYLVTYT